MFLAALTAAATLDLKEMESTAQVSLDSLLKNSDGAFNLFFKHTDVDECLNGSHNCHNKAVCTDTVGSYECTCNSGYEGDGTNCTSMSLIAPDALHLHH